MGGSAVKSQSTNVEHELLLNETYYTSSWANVRRVFPNTYIKSTVHRPLCYGKKRRDTSIGGRSGASRARSREFMATGLRDRRRNVGCRLRLSTRARERDASSLRRFVPRRAFPTIRGTFQRDQRERWRCLGKTADNDRYSLERRRENTVPLSLSLYVSVNQL